MSHAFLTVGVGREFAAANLQEVCRLMQNLGIGGNSKAMQRRDALA
jgi:hypothetical protein